jgi:hypothetical protein
VAKLEKFRGAFFVLGFWAEEATRFDALAKLTGVGGSDILLVSDYIAKEH